ncbi:hypothetical protein C8R46DRAFT_1137911 [Mycena filopes]|nr:hypothetical protein C8R46DRAFT_1137911 [Mycena filopes]
MKHSSLFNLHPVQILLASSLFLARHYCSAANTTQTPPQFDPDSKVCPGSCLGQYVNNQFAVGNCFGTVGLCVCTGTQDSPPLGNLTSCLESSTCNMSAADSQTYISGLLSFEGCTVTSTSIHSDSDSGSTSSGGSLGTGTQGAPVPSSNAANDHSAHAGELVGLGTTLVTALLGTLLVN